MVGSGNFGSALVRILGRNATKHDVFDDEVKMYVHEEMIDGVPLTKIINEQNENVKYLKGKGGGIVIFGIKTADAPAAGKSFIDNLKVIAHVANVGDARTLVIHPASTTHQQLTTEQQIAAGVKPAGVRISVGYEDLEDIKADIDQAVAVARA